jgi:ankyrin repeat protein
LIRSCRVRCYETTALHVIRHNSEHFVPMVQILVDYGANINIQNSKGNTILHDILSYPYLSITGRGKFFQFLLHDCRADFLTVKNHRGQTAWDTAMPMTHKPCFFMMERQRRRFVYSSLLLRHHCTPDR